MNILILGGTHLIGPWVIQILLRHGHMLTVFNRGQTKAELPPDVNRIYGDRRHLYHYKNELQKCAPDVVIDMIAMTESDAQQVVEIFQTVAKRLIVISSADVYLAHEKLCQGHSDLYESMPLHENSTLRQQAYPYRNYAKHNEEICYLYDKGLVEKIINTTAMNSTILRLPYVYGPGDYSRVFPYLKNMVEMNSIIMLDKHKSGWHSTRGYAEDMAAAITQATVDKREGKFIYNVGEIESFTEKQWVQNIATLMNWQGLIVEKEKNELPEKLQEPFDWNQPIILDTTMIRRDLQYQETNSREQALKNTIQWILANMPSE